jgi:DNA-binding NarL/FixJ family response regulator
LFEVTPELRPDVVLLDFSLPGDLNALEVCRRLKETTPEVQVVAFTVHDDADLKRAAYEAGASGFVWKLQIADELLRTIQRVVADRV